MITKVYTIQELSEVVAKDMGLDLNKEWNVKIDFYKDSDNYIFKIEEANNNE